ncbi:TonB-dependent receptor [Sorangium cellulosum]|uniref:TonB-dependent receptor n=2 Tax=Sorangium cellulosum TaxID=56 RepID=A0A2L0F234_SORCE|nr:TonB-dependent receptor [Sorangium cellulosum]
MALAPLLITATTWPARADDGAAPPPAAASAEGPATAAEGPPASPGGGGASGEAAGGGDAPVTVVVRGAAPPRSASESVRERAEIRAAPHRTASDVLQLVPGVFVTQHGGEGKAHQIFFRGFDAAHGQDIEIWVAGAPVNEVSNVHGQGYADLHFVMPEVIRELRAQPGSYDPRQGDFAVAGTMRFELGYDEPGITATAGAGSFGARRLFLAYHPEQADEATFAAFEAQETDGFGPARAASRASLVAQAVLQPSERITARVMASAFAARFGSAGVLRLDDLEEGKVDRFASYDPKQGGDSSRAQLVLDVRAPGGRGEGFSIAPFVVLRSLRLRSNYTGYLADPVSGDATQQLNEALTLGAVASYRLRFPLLSDRDAIEAGVVARSDWITQSQRRLAAVDDRPTATLVDARVRATDLAGYLDASIRPARRIELRGGVRVDGLAFQVVEGATEGALARGAQGVHVGGKGTIDAALLPGLHALASVGQGFRSPQARSLGDGERTPFTRALSAELGLRYADEVARASVALFHARLGEDLVFDEATGRNEPVPATARTGVALDAVAHPAPWLVSSAGITTTRAAFTASGGRAACGGSYAAGDLLPFVPQVVARTDLAVTPRLGTLLGRPLEARAGAGVTLLHRRPLPCREIGHDALLTDVTAHLRYHHVEVGIDVHNLLDAAWFDGEFVYPSSFTRGAAPDRLPARHVTVGAPRSLFVSLSLYLG